MSQKQSRAVDSDYFLGNENAIPFVKQCIVQMGYMMQNTLRKWRWEMLLSSRTENCPKSNKKKKINMDDAEGS